MLDIGWSELFVIGIVGLVVIGPKDLPVMFRTVGRFAARARVMARDFQRAMDSAADDTGMKDVARDLKNIASPRSMGLDAMQNAAQRFEKWDPLKRPAPTATGAGVAAAAAKPDVPPAPTPVPAPPVAADVPPATVPPPAFAAFPGGTLPVTNIMPPPRRPATTALAAELAAKSANIKARAAAAPAHTPPLPEVIAAEPPKKARKAAKTPHDGPDSPKAPKKASVATAADDQADTSAEAVKPPKSRAAKKGGA